MSEESGLLTSQAQPFPVVKSDQETFNLVAKHLLTQKARARGKEDGTCAYRGLHGTKCAIGILIPDEKYLPSFEGRSCVDPDIAKVLNEEGYNNFALLPELQRIHDWLSVDNWKEDLNKLADEFKLSAEVLHAF